MTVSRFFFKFTCHKPHALKKEYILKRKYFVWLTLFILTVLIYLEYTLVGRKGISLANDKKLR